MNKQPPSKKKYDKQYLKNNCRQITLLLNRNTDKDILDHLDKVANRNGYLKQLIRNDMK